LICFSTVNAFSSSSLARNFAPSDPKALSFCSSLVFTCSCLERLRCLSLSYVSWSLRLDFAWPGKRDYLSTADSIGSPILIWYLRPEDEGTDWFARMSRPLLSWAA
jgi:hypothetical protein